MKINNISNNLGLDSYVLNVKNYKSINMYLYTENVQIYN